MTPNETPNEAKDVASERGPNYDWKHEAEHYSAECDRLRQLLGKVEAQGERDAYALDALKAELKAANERCEELAEMLIGARKTIISASDYMTSCGYDKHLEEDPEFQMLMDCKKFLLNLTNSGTKR